MKIAICDYEKCIREEIINCLSVFHLKNEQLHFFEYDYGEELVMHDRDTQVYDLIFINIKSNKLSGIEVGKQIRKQDDSVLIFLLSDNQQYVPDAFAINAFQMIMKPINKSFLMSEFERAFKKYQRKKFQYNITYKGKSISLAINDIYYIETYNRHLRAVTKKGLFEFLGVLKIEEEKLIQYDFIRCHRCYIINMKHIICIDKNVLSLINDAVIPIGRQMKNSVINEYKHYNTSILGEIL